MTKRHLRVPFSFRLPLGRDAAGVDIFVQQLFNGLTLGAVYAVVALGYTMVYGIIQLINFAHGEVVMIGAMVAFTVINVLAPAGLPPVVVVLVGMGCAIPVCMLVGYAMERLAYRPLRRVSPVVDSLARTQFDEYVKRVRIFVVPAVRERVSKLPSLQQLVEQAVADV